MTLEEFYNPATIKYVVKQISADKKKFKHSGNLERVVDQLLDNYTDFRTGHRPFGEYFKKPEGKQLKDKENKLKSEINNKETIDRLYNNSETITLKIPKNKEGTNCFSKTGYMTDIIIKYEDNYPKNESTISEFFTILFTIPYSGKAAPVGCIVKSNTINSAVLVGCKNNCPTN